MQLAWQESSLYRSLNYNKDINPGVVVLSDEVNEAWPKLMNLFAYYCKQNGIDVMAKPVVTQFPERDKPRMEVDGDPGGIPGSVPRDHEEARARLSERCLGRHGGLLDHFLNITPNLSKTLIPMWQQELSPWVLWRVRRPRLAPLGTTAKKAVKNNDRLVLGERDVAIQEALDHGGAFIDLNPEILRTLRAGNIDPYLIYEKGMLNKIEEKIGRIDFAKVNVDEVYEQWKGKASDSGSHPCPVDHVAQENAAGYRYEQSGNSWIRK